MVLTYVPVCTSGSLMLCEFDYTLEPMESFPFDQAVPRKSMYFLKKHVFPFLYFNALVKGEWGGLGPWPKGRFAAKPAAKN